MDRFYDGVKHIEFREFVTMFNNEFEEGNIRLLYLLFEYVRVSDKKINKIDRVPKTKP